MKAYPTYKDSGIKRIGSVPEHWVVLPLKRYLTVKSGDFHKTENDFKNGIAYPIYGGNGLRGYSNIYNREGNTLLIGRVGAKCGNIHLVEDKFWVSEHALIVLPKQGLSDNYFKYLIEVVDLNKYSIKTAQPLINASIVENQMVGVPIDIQEQTQIASFLNYKTKQIDDLITKKKKLIELLKEERAAIINQAITKGLDPNVPMKDSGIEWLGEIPETWSVKSVGHLSKVVRGASPRPAGDSTLFNGNYLPWITVKEVTNAKGKFITDTETYLTKLGSEQTRIVVPETLLLSNSGATLGVPRITKIKGGINDGSLAFFNLSIDRDFLYYFFTTHTDIFREEASGYGQPNLNTDIVKSLKTPLPSAIEQIMIVEFIESSTVEFDSLIYKIEKELDLIKEYKTSLINEAVTGKIDLRDSKIENTLIVA